MDDTLRCHHGHNFNADPLAELQPRVFQRRLRTTTRQCPTRGATGAKEVGWSILTAGAEPAVHERNSLEQRVLCAHFPLPTISNLLCGVAHAPIEGCFLPVWFCVDASPWWSIAHGGTQFWERMNDRHHSRTHDLILSNSPLTLGHPGNRNHPVTPPVETSRPAAHRGARVQIACVNATRPSQALAFATSSSSVTLAGSTCTTRASLTQSASPFPGGSNLSCRNRAFNSGKHASRSKSSSGEGNSPRGKSLWTEIQRDESPRHRMRRNRATPTTWSEFRVRTCNTCDK